MPEYPIKFSDSNPKNSSPVSSPYMGEGHPVLIFHWDKDYKLPDAGEMTITFHKHRQTDTTEEGEISQTVELHVESIEKVTAKKMDEPPKSDRETASEALDKYAEEASDEMEME